MKKDVQHLHSWMNKVNLESQNFLAIKKDHRSGNPKFLLKLTKT